MPPALPPLSYFFVVFQGGDRRRAVPFLGDATVNTPCPPPPFHEWWVVWGVNKRHAVPCLGDGVQYRAWARLPLTCLALPPVIFVLRIMFCFSPSILTIIVFPHTNTVREFPSRPSYELALLFSSAITGSS